MICLIGNSGLHKHGVDGQTEKVRLYLKKIKDEGYEVCFIDLEFFTRRPFSTLHKIKKAIKECDRIVLITAERGCRILIPFINKINKKYNKPFILPLVGTSVLHYSIDRLTDAEKNDFIVRGKYELCKAKKGIRKHLSKINYILPETDLISKVYKEFYGINNVITITNFRDFESIDYVEKKKNDVLRIIFLSRVMEQKGIFDLLDAVTEINENTRVDLDIFGQLVLSKQETEMMNKYLSENIKYFGPLEHSKVVKVISNYDLFVFPTRFACEGVPGVIVESLIAGIPVLTSNFPQAPLILNDGSDSLFFEMFDKQDLKEKIIRIINDSQLLLNLKQGALENGKHYVYKNVRIKFLKYVCGAELKEATK